MERPITAREPFLSGRPSQYHDPFKPALVCAVTGRARTNTQTNKIKIRSFIVFSLSSPSEWSDLIALADFALVHHTVFKSHFHRLELLAFDFAESRVFRVVAFRVDDSPAGQIVLARFRPFINVRARVVCQIEADEHYSVFRRVEA